MKRAVANCKRLRCIEELKGGRSCHHGPIRFASRQKEIDPFADKRRQVPSEHLCLIAHQRAHEHRQQNQIHENLSCGDASFVAEGPLRRTRKWISGVVQEVGNGIRGTIPRGFMKMSAQRRKSVGFGNRDTSNADGIFDKSFDKLRTQNS